METKPPLTELLSGEAKEKAQQILDRIKEAEAERLAAKTLWLSHHYPAQYERCAVIRGRHVCRRCLVLYPVGLLSTLLWLLSLPLWPVELDALLVWGLCLPGTWEFIEEQLGKTQYSPRRQIAVTIPLAIAYGRGFALLFTDLLHPLFWGPILIYGAAWGLAWLVERSKR